jgi:Putative amidoligase enzyme
MSKRQGLELLLKAGDEKADPLSLVNNTRTREVLLELVDSQSGQERLAYNIQGLKLSNSWMRIKKDTIEFRQHESTIDGQRIVHWIKFCVGLVQFAYTVPFSILEPFLQAHIDDSAEDFSVVPLLKAIGLPSQMLFYGMSLPHQDVQSEEQYQQQQEKGDRTPTSSQNGPTDAEPAGSEARIARIVEEIDNRQPVQKPTTLDTDGFEDIPL